MFMVKTVPLRTRSQGKAVSILSLTVNFLHQLNSSNWNSPLGYSESLTLLLSLLLIFFVFPSSFPDFSASSSSPSLLLVSEESNARTEKVRRGREGEGEEGETKREREKRWWWNWREEREGWGLELERKEVRVWRWKEVIWGVWRRRSLDIFAKRIFTCLCVSRRSKEEQEGREWKRAEHVKEREKKKGEVSSTSSGFLTVTVSFSCAYTRFSIYTTKLLGFIFFFSFYFFIKIFFQYKTLLKPQTQNIFLT